MDFEAFGIDWKTSPTKTRGILFLGGKRPDFLRDLQHRAKDAGNLVIARLHEQLVSGKREAKGLNRSVGHELVSEFQDQLISEWGFTLQRMRRSVAFRAVRVVNGVIKRFSEPGKPPVIPKSPPRLKNDFSTYVEDGVLTDLTPDEQNGVLRIQYGKEAETRYELNYHIPNGAFKNKKYLPQSFGGNIVSTGDRWRFMASAKIPFNWQYTPVAPYGVDFNKDKRYLAVFSDGDIIEATPAIDKCVRRLKKLNQEIKDRSLVKKSSQRRAVRRKVQQAHRRLKRLCLPIVEKILAKVVQNKLLLCIDDLTCGRRTGSFGHDKLVYLLRYFCEERGIPFVLVPTHYTSQVHFNCQQLAFRKGTETTAHCPICGQEYNSHFNAAQNIGRFGWCIWQNGLKEFLAWRKPISVEFNRRKPKKAALEAVKERRIKVKPAVRTFCPL